VKRTCHPIFWFLIVSLSVTRLAAQFEPVQPTGLPYHVVITAVLIDSVPAAVGTVIGIFDDTLCVGVDTVTSDSGNIDIVTWEGSTNPDLPGFTAGNPISVQLYASVYDTEVFLAADLTFETGNGLFGYGSYSAVALSAVSGLAPDITAITDTVTLDSVQIGDSTTAQITFQNQGNVPLTVYSVTSDTGLFMIPDYSGQVAAGDTVDLTITFTPIDIIMVTGHIVIESNDPDQPTLLIPVSGEGLPPPPVVVQPLPDIELLEDSGPDTILVALNDYFTDNYIPLTFFAISSDTSALQALTLGAEALVVEPQPNWFGAVNIYVGATNGYFNVYDTVQVTVQGVNDPPESFTLETVDTVFIDLENVETDSLSLSWAAAADVEGDPVTYTFAAELRALASAGGAVLYNMGTTLTASRVHIAYNLLAEFIDEQELVNAELEWDVIAMDGMDSTWSANGPVVAVVDIQGTLGIEDDLLPLTFALYQNYPNPFNPTTIISYDLPEATRVELVIYDILGQRVVTIKNGRQEAGSYHVRWNGTNDLGAPVSTGLYFYQLNSTPFSATRKMVFMK
jgi:hypothetical protein